jgi:hypothetical protein
VHFHNAADALRRAKTISYGGKAQFLSLAAAMALLTMSRGLADDELIDPFLLQADAIAGGRSPTPASAMSATTVPPRGGAERLRAEAQRPALSGDGDSGPQGNANASLWAEDEVWQIRAFVKSTDHY